MGTEIVGVTMEIVANTPIMHSYQCCSSHDSDYWYLLGWCQLLGRVLTGAVEVGGKHFGDG